MQTDYIRREDAIRLAEQGQVQGFPWQFQMLVRLPPTDVVEVKHGEWMSVPEVWGSFDIQYYCSECGKDAIINNSERYVLSDYCPHCGAIMDNKRGNENGLRGIKA